MKEVSAVKTNAVTCPKEMSTAARWKAKNIIIFFIVAKECCNCQLSVLEVRYV
jgi:hypothetical protein